MSDDLVRRLKSCAKDCTMLGDEVDAAFFNEAAQALTEARAEIERLRKALNEIDALDPEEHSAGCSIDALRGLVIRMGEIARAALNGGRADG